MSHPNQLLSLTDQYSQQPETLSVVDAADDVDLPDPPLVPEAFSIHDADTASWLIRKVNEARAHVDRVKVWAAAEIRRAERDENFLFMRYGRQLEDWAGGEIAKLRGRRRSLSLPGGICGYRKLSALIVIQDERAVLQWARQHLPSAIVTVERLQKTVLNEHFEESGELPPEGVHLQPPQDRFYIRA